MIKNSSQSLLQRLAAKGATVTEARKAVCRVLEKATDHPDAFQIHERARNHEARISVASVYRILSLLEKHDLVEKHDFKDKRTRFEVKRTSPNDHLIDLKSGAVIEFTDPELEDLKAKIAARLGYRLEEHSLELYGRPI
ncbi:MAG: transcriptional repressor [Pseudomonadota bacterium]